MDDEQTRLHKEKIEAFFESKIPVHVTCKSKEWHNGIIISLKEKFFIINERKKGPIPITYAEIYSIDKLDQEASVDKSFIGEGVCDEEYKKRGWT